VFDRFTDRARKVMGFSRMQSQAWNHDYIGTEHVLLGLLEEGSGVAGDVLASLDVEAEPLRAEVRRRMQQGTAPVTMGQLPFTPGAKKTLEHALEEAHGFGHNYIGTEHLLLGLIRDRDGIAGAALAACGVRAEGAREKTLERLSREAPRDEDRPSSLPAHVIRQEIADLRLRIAELERMLREREEKEG